MGSRIHAVHRGVGCLEQAIESARACGSPCALEYGQMCRGWALSAMHAAAAVESVDRAVKLSDGLVRRQTSALCLRAFVPTSPSSIAARRRPSRTAVEQPHLFLVGQLFGPIAHALVVVPVGGALPVAGCRR